MSCLDIAYFLKLSGQQYGTDMHTDKLTSVVKLPCAQPVRVSV